MGQHCNNINGFFFIIIPDSRPVYVTEGENAFLSLDNIHILTSYYEDKIAEFLLVSTPRHGNMVTSGPNPDRNATIFSISQLKSRQIKVKQLSTLSGCSLLLNTILENEKEYLQTRFMFYL